jgi:hypothetical protein
MNRTDNNWDVPRPPPPGVHIPWGYWGPVTSPVDLYKKANRGHKEKKDQVYGRRVNRKWAVS